MDHARLKRVLAVVSLCVWTAGCASKSFDTARDPRVPVSVLESELSPRKVFSAAETYLTYHLGYTLSVRDLERGLIVSDWSREDPLERHQVTLRVLTNIKGSVVSAHLKTEALTQTGWRDVPTLGDRESKFLGDFRDYLSLQSKARSP